MQALVILGSQFRGRLLLDRLNPPDLRGARPSLYFFPGIWIRSAGAYQPGSVGCHKFTARAVSVRSGGAPWQGGAFQWVQAPPGELAPAGSDRSSHGGNEMAEAFD